MKGEELVSIVMPAYNVEKYNRRINRKCFVSNNILNWETLINLVNCTCSFMY